MASEFAFTAYDDTTIQATNYDWALSTILNAQTISIKDCTALEDKIKTINQQRRIAGLIAQLRVAHQELLPEIDEIKKVTLWNQVRPSLERWEILWRAKLPSKQFRASLSHRQRKSCSSNMEPFDIARLPTKQFEFLIFYTYALNEPLNESSFKQVFDQCSEFASIGATIRDYIDINMNKSRLLARHALRKSNKRKLETTSEGYGDQGKI